MPEITDKNHVIILAGGKGTRMQSQSPKVLRRLKSAPLISRLLTSIAGICRVPTIVVGYEGEKVTQALGSQYHYVWQKEQLGTGHAVQSAKSALASRSEIENIIILPGDHPFISTETLNSLLRVHEEQRAVVTIATVTAPNFEGEFRIFYHCGRVVRDQNQEIQEIVEFKDATPAQKAISEVHVSYYCFAARWLWENIDKLTTDDNEAGEYYLTDLIKIASDQKRKVSSVAVRQIFEGAGVNTEEELKLIQQLSY